MMPRSSVLQLAAIGLVLVVFAMARTTFQSDDVVEQLRAAVTALCATFAVLGIARSRPWARYFVVATSIAIWTQLFYPAPAEEDVSAGLRIAVIVLVSALLLLMNIDIWQRLGRASRRNDTPRPAPRSGPRV